MNSRNSQPSKNGEQRDRRHEMVYPFKRQIYSYDCGASCMETVQTCYGYSVREDSIMKIAGTDKNGTTLEGLMRVAKKYGLKFKACENMTIDDLKKSINSRRPCITPIQVWRSSTKGSWESDWRHGHYVVPIGYDNTNIYIH